MSRTLRLDRPSVRVLFVVLVILALYLGYAVARPMLHAHAAPIRAVATPVPELMPAQAPLLDCSGYSNPKRYPVGDQSWWMAVPPQQGTSNGHLHLDTCFPLGETISGVVHFDVLLTMHDNPGKLVSLTVQIGGSGQYVAAKRTFNPALTCADTCTWPVAIDVDTRGFANDGSQEMRWRARVVTPDGKDLFTSTSWEVNLHNGKPVSDYRPLLNYIGGKGWYTALGYTKSIITAGFPYGSAVSGTWTLQVKCEASGRPVTGCSARIDPNLHMGIDGWIVLQRPGPYKGPVVVDTHKLANGWHRFMLKTDAVSVDDSTASGILTFWFFVNNP
jgi:hypothetical protein